jgi:hypothetical protein
MKDKLLNPNTSGIVSVSPSILAGLPKSLTSDKLKFKAAASHTTSYMDYPGWCNDHVNLSWDFYQYPEKIEVLRPNSINSQKKNS